MRVLIAVVLLAAAQLAEAEPRFPLMDIQTAPAVGGGVAFPLTTDVILTDPGVTATFGGAILIPDGTDGAPGIAFADDTNTGIYRAGTDKLMLSAGAGINLMVGSLGTTINRSLRWHAAGNQSGVPYVALVDGQAADSTLYLVPNQYHIDATPALARLAGQGGSGADIAGADLGLAGGKGTGAGAPGCINLETGTTLGSGSTLQTLTTRLSVCEGAVTSTVPFLAPAGTLADPGMGWAADADGSGTGFYRPTANEIGVSLNGTLNTEFLATKKYEYLPTTRVSGAAVSWTTSTTNPAATPAVTDLGRGAALALTESSATTVFSTVISNGITASGIIEYRVYAKDGSADQQIRMGQVRYAATNKATATTCTIHASGATDPNETEDGSVLVETAGGSTLTYAWTSDNGTANSCIYKLTAVSSLTQTTLDIRHRQTNFGTTVPTLP